MVAKNHNDYNSDTRIALLEKTNEHIYEALERIEKRFDKIDERFDRVDKQFDKVDKQFDKVDKQFDRIDKQIDKLDSKIDSRFFWLLSFYVAGFGSLFGIMGHGFHWF